MVMNRSYAHSLYNNYHGEYVFLKKIPLTPQISGEGMYEKHMIFGPSAVVVPCLSSTGIDLVLTPIKATC